MENKKENLEDFFKKVYKECGANGVMFISNFLKGKAINVNERGLWSLIGSGVFSVKNLETSLAFFVKITLLQPIHMGVYGLNTKSFHIDI